MHSEINCEHCGATFVPGRSTQRFCQGTCKVKWWQRPENQRSFRIQHKLRHPEKRLLKGARDRAKEFGLPFDIKWEDIVIPVCCPILGIPLESNVGKGKGANPCAPSLDRIVPDLGYVKGNIQVISFKANSMKRDGTAEELLRFAEWIIETYKEGENK